MISVFGLPIALGFLSGCNEIDFEDFGFGSYDLSSEFPCEKIEGAYESSADSPYAGGDGSSESPYGICTEEQFVALSTRSQELAFEFHSWDKSRSDWARVPCSPLEIRVPRLPVILTGADIKSQILI